jgi:hypothetical protein
MYNMWLLTVWRNKTISKNFVLKLYELQTGTDQSFEIYLARKGVIYCSTGHVVA